MGITDILHRQWPAAVPAFDDSLFDTAALVFTVRRSIDAPVEAVWQAFVDDHTFEWIPFPGVGVHYESPARGAGITRAMGSVHRFRPLWVQWERFWRYEPLQRFTFGVVGGNWSYTLLTRQYGENMEFASNRTGGTDLAYTVAVTPRAPFRFATLGVAAPVWRVLYRIGGVGPLFERRVRTVQNELQRDESRRTRTAASLTPSIPPLQEPSNDHNHRA